MTKNQNASKFCRERDQQGAISLRISLVLGHWDYLGNEPSCQKGLWVQAKQSQKGKNNPWHLCLYSYCINWTHYAMIGFFCWFFFSFFSKMSVSLIQNSPLRAAAVFIQATGPDAWIPTPSSRVYKTLNENGRNQSNNVGRAGIHPNLLHTLA